MNRSTFLRKYSFRLALWVISSTAFCYAVRSPRLWVGGDETGDPPLAEQRMAANFDAVQAGWWTPNPSLVSITSLLSDFYGEVPEPAMITLEVKPTPRETLRSASSRDSSGTRLIASISVQ